MTTQELALQEKEELQERKEATHPMKIFSPKVDIFEDSKGLTMVAELPGVKSEDVDINLENRVLTINATLDIEEYQGLKPLYSEYNIGSFSRQFSLGEEIDEAGIEAKVDNGCLNLYLPKSQAAQARKITIK